MNHLKFVSPQARTIYELLVKNSSMTSKEIGKELKIFPNAVYRSIKNLMSLGLVQSQGKYPVKFEAKMDGLDAYLLSTRESLLKSFFPEGITENQQPLNISFIQSRSELLEKTNEDISKAKNEARFIVSGLEVPAETILEYKKAVERGVKIRVLVQRMDEVSREMFLNWQKIGIEVRYFPLLEARILIFDTEIVYMTSYNSKNQEESVGIRFDYPPIAKLMVELFESRWENSTEISSSSFAKLETE